MALELDWELVAAVAAVAELGVPPEDRELLVAVLDNQLAGSRSLLELDVSEVEPIVSFDPRWR
jgi:hypothetical protein